jgi:hypothetical protein
MPSARAQHRWVAIRADWVRLVPRSDFKRGNDNAPHGDNSDVADGSITWTC